MSALLSIVWVSCGAAVVVAAVRSRHSQRAARAGQLAVGVLYLAAGALVNALMLATGEDYSAFADSSNLAFVRDTWRSLVVPNHELFISLLIVFEAIVGMLALAGGRRAQAGLVAAVGFHIALLTFGWGFYLWSIPMLGALSLLLLATRRPGPRVDPEPADQRQAA